MTNNELHDKAVFFVMSNTFSEWDNNLPFCRLLEAIADDNRDAAYPWEPFEDMDSQDLANHVADSVKQLVNLFQKEVA